MTLPRDSLVADKDDNKPHKLKKDKTKHLSPPDCLSLLKKPSYNKKRENRHALYGFSCIGKLIEIFLILELNTLKTKKKVPTT